jgi:hypothetical protein
MTHLLLHTAPFYFNHSFQDPEDGGIADRPGNMVDVFHTHFGIAGVCVVRFCKAWLRSFLICAYYYIKDFPFLDILI